MSNETLSSQGDTIRLEDWDRAQEVSSTKEVRASENLSRSIEDFAVLRPVGQLAPVRFDELARRMLADQDWQPHARQFIHITRKPTNPSDVKVASQAVYTGYYRFNLSILPLDFTHGWVPGSGRADIPNHGGVDLLLTLHGENDGVKGRHAQVHFHSNSRMLMMKAVSRNIVVCNGQEIGREPQVLPHRSGITFGSLTYCLEFSVMNKKAFSGQRDELMRRHRLWSRQAPPSLDPTPSENHFVSQGFQFQTPQAAGAYGVVSLCVQVTTGELYAAKRVQRTMRTLASVREEIKILRDVSKHV